MDILLYVGIGAGALLILAAVWHVVAKRRGEKVQNDLHAEDQQDQQVKLAPDIKQVSAHLAEHNVDDEVFTKHFQTSQSEFNISKGMGQEPNPLLVERLNSLYDNIEFQINEDNEWLVYFSAKDRHNLLSHHRNWREIQRNIAQMIDLTPKQ